MFKEEDEYTSLPLPTEEKKEENSMETSSSFFC